MYQKLTVLQTGSRITFVNGQPLVPDDPIIPYIRVDGTGVDIWPAAQRVFDTVVAKAYGGKRCIEWFKIYAGDEACEVYGTYQYLPEDTLTAICEYSESVHKGNIMKYTEGAFRDWGYELTTSEFRVECITERESWILDNQAKNPDLSVEDNARLIEPGFDALTIEKQDKICQEVKGVLEAIGSTHGHHQWK